MDELVIDGKTYVSSKRAAAITGYAKDYIGQLCREGRVEARLVGRSWYVYEPSLKKHRYNEQGEEAESSEDQSPEVEVEAEESTEKTNIQAVWEEPVYQSEPTPILPISEEEKPPVEEPEPIEAIESEWQSWFSTSTEPTEEPQITEEEKIKEETLDVPLHIVRPVETPKVEYVDIPRAPAASIAAEKSVQPKIVRAHKEKSHLVAKATLVAVMLIAVSVALIGTGAGRMISGTTLTASGFIGFFEGVNEIKNQAN